MSSSLEGKSAIITGAGTGINLAFAIALLKEGVNVLIADLALRPESENVLHQYKDKPKAIFQKTDVTSWADLTNMFTVAQDAFGAIDIVCPGAGVFEPPFSAFWYPPGTPESVDDPNGNHYKSMEINLTHPVRTTQLAISHFLGRTAVPNISNRRTIVHISSIAGETAHLSFPMYHAAKWGVVGFVRSMAMMEPEFGIRVAGVCPGIVRTPLWTDNVDKMALVTSDGVVQDNWITPEQVAEVMMSIVKDTELIDRHGNKFKPVGGTLIEVAAGTVREIKLYNDSGPDGDANGMMAVNIKSAEKNALSRLRTHGWGQVSVENK